MQSSVNLPDLFISDSTEQEPEAQDWIQLEIHLFRGEATPLRTPECVFWTEFERRR